LISIIPNIIPGILEGSKKLLLRGADKLGIYDYP